MMLNRTNNVKGIQCPKHGLCGAEAKCMKCVDEIKGQAALVPELLKALQEVEWVDKGTLNLYCPWCCRWPRVGHSPNCQRQTILDKAEALL